MQSEFIEKKSQIKPVTHTHTQTVRIKILVLKKFSHNSHFQFCTDSFLLSYRMKKKISISIFFFENVQILLLFIIIYRLLKISIHFVILHSFQYIMGIVVIIILKILNMHACL